MSKTITYKTKYTKLDPILRVVEDLVSKGAFGKDVDVKTKGEDGFNPGLFRPRDPNEEVMIVVRDKDRNSKEFGAPEFYEKGFAVARNKQTGEIVIVYDYDYNPEAAKVTESTRKKIGEMIDAGESYNRIKSAAESGGTITKVENAGEPGWSMEIEFTPEQLKDYMNRAK